jgi:eukaryotic-like serine/threonine-protein kinase
LTDSAGRNRYDPGPTRMDEPLLNRDGVLQQLERVLSSVVFRRAERSSALLRFIVEQTLDGQADRLKEYTLGAEALGRGETFDPRTDPVVRAEASRLRTRLEQYYETIGGGDPVLVTLPKGTYVPQFATRTAPVEEAATERPQEPPLRVSRGLISQRLPWACAAVAIALAAVIWVRDRPDTARPAPFVQFEVELKSDGVLASDVGTAVVVSPDGTRVVFVSRTADGRTHLSTRRLDQPTVLPLPGTDGARGPFVSPDGRWVGFWADGKLKKVSVDGGSPVILCDASDLLGASWGEGGTIIAALGAPGKLWRIPAEGGMPQAAIDISAESTGARWPQILPGGQFVLYTATTGAGADRATIEVQALRGGDRKVLVSGGAFGRYLTSGHLAYVNQGTLYAMPFDLEQLAVSGVAVPVLDDVSYSPLFGYAQIDVSQTGTLVYRKSAESGLSVVDWIDRAGKRAPLLAKPSRYAWLRLSPDGRRLAVTATESGAGSILLHDIQKGETTRITDRPGDYTGLTWLPNGSLLFGGAGGMAWIPTDRPADSTHLTDVRVNQTPWSVAPDGRQLAYYDRDPETGFDLWTVAVATSPAGLEIDTARPFLQTRAFEVYPSFSPDGRWIAYASNESGAWEVYVRRFPDSGTKVRVSASGGSVPRWSSNGRELLYRTEAQRIMVVTYTSRGDTFVSTPPRPWAPQPLADTGVLPNFDVAPDGERVLALMPVARPEEQQSVNHVTFMLNVSEEIRTRMNAR